MKPKRNLALAVLAGLALSLAPAGSGAAHTERADSFAVTHVRVFDGQRVLHDVTVVVRNGRIGAVGRHLDVPSNLPEIDGSGKTLLPGIIDSHGHVRERRLLERAAQFGITTIMDMQSVNPFATQMVGEQRRDEAHDRADLFSAIYPATVKDGYPYNFTPEAGAPTLESPEEADEFVRQRLAEGSHHIKIFLEDGEFFGLPQPLPVLNRETVRALVRAAHRRGRLAVAHATVQRFARQAVEDGVDALEHAFSDTPVTDSLLRLARERGIFLVGTMAITESFITTAGGESLVADPELGPYLTPEEIAFLITPRSSPLTLENLQILKDNVGRFHAAGIPVLTGSDTQFHGPTVHRDIELLVESGLTPREALIGATSAAARAYGLSDRGRIAPGLRADLLLVEGDPTVSIKAVRALRKIWKGGVEVVRPLGGLASRSTGARGLR